MGSTGNSTQVIHATRARPPSPIRHAFLNFIVAIPHSSGKNGFRFPHLHHVDSDKGRGNNQVRSRFEWIRGANEYNWRSRLTSESYDFPKRFWKCLKEHRISFRRDSLNQVPFLLRSQEGMHWRETQKRWDDLP